MITLSLVSMLLVSVCMISLSLGIQVLLNHHRLPAGRCFFAVILAVSLWSAGLAFAAIASDEGLCEFWRRISAVGWGAIYVLLLHFILILTGKRVLLERWWFYVLLYLPAAVTIFAFAIPNRINASPYQLFLTDYGWVNVAEHNMWDMIFYAYYMGYTAIGLLLVARWGKKATDSATKHQARTILLSTLAALILASITDVVLPGVLAQMPQMAPVIILMPMLAIYHTLRTSSLKTLEPADKKRNYAKIVACITLFVILTFFQVRFSASDSAFNSTCRGIVTQLQMLVSIYLVLQGDKSGYITAVLLNVIGVFNTVLYMFRGKSLASLPGTISYLGVLMILALIHLYKTKTVAYIGRINSQKQSLEDSEKKLYRMAYYDPVTELPNRAWFVDYLDRSIPEAKRNAVLIGVMFIDFDSFKSVNDTAGHAAGDLVLKEMASRIASCLREEDVIARFGGDEFLIKTATVHSVEDIRIISNRILDVFKKPVYIQEYEYFISASVGVAVYPVDGEDSQTLLRNADIAMYSAKNKGKNQCVYYTSGIKEDIVTNIRLTNNLHRALDKHELFLYYQPQVSAKTQEITGFEALLRWKNDEFGMVSPAVFIPMAEQTGLIKPIGLWVIQTACEQLKTIRDKYHKDFKMSVNLSLLQLKDAAIVTRIKDILDATGTDAKDINFEITESIAFIKDPFVLQRVQDIKRFGSAIHIDDFGTGFSSFSRLKSFPVDVIKIDIEFVRGIGSKSRKDRAIIKSIIQIAKNLSVGVLAEGVETEEQFVYLKEHGCDEIQGFYFYKPMAANDLESVLAGLTGLAGFPVLA